MEIAKALPTGMLLSDRYRILQILGEGGMSRVYLADDTRLNTRVAIKENLQTSSAAQTQFQQEAQILAHLSHPNLPRVMDHFVDSTTGRQYLVMDYVEGEDLESIIKRQGPLAENVALAWVRQVLEALEYLHGQKPPIVHRDVKPGNVKITPEGKAVLVDFGLAKVYDPRQATLTGARAMTPGYAPPEQYGLRTSERSDIYGLGATLYTALTGNVPPEAPLRVAGEMALISPRQIIPRLSPSTEQAVMRAMELDTQRRWQTVSELRAALEGKVKAPPRQRSPALIWGIGIGLAVVLIAAVLLFAGGEGETTTAVKPTDTSTPTAAPTDTSVLTATPLPPTSTPVPPTPTSEPPTSTPVPPTATPVVPTPTPVVVVVVTPTPEEPTATLEPTATPTPPTPTPAPSTDKCVVTVKNYLPGDLILNIGPIRFDFKPGEERTIEFPSGRHDYTADCAGAAWQGYAGWGTHDFPAGYWHWSFYARAGTRWISSYFDAGEHSWEDSGGW